LTLDVFLGEPQLILLVASCHHKCSFHSEDHGMGLSTSHHEDIISDVLRVVESLAIFES